MSWIGIDMLPWMVKQADAGNMPKPIDVYHALRASGAPKEVAESVGKQWLNYLHLQKRIESLPEGSPEAAAMREQAEAMRNNIREQTSPYMQGHDAQSGANNPAPKGGPSKALSTAPAVAKNELALRGGPVTPSTAQAAVDNKLVRRVGPAAPSTADMWRHAVKEPQRMYGKAVEQAVGKAVGQSPAAKKSLINAAKGAFKRHKVLGTLGALAAVTGGGTLLYNTLGGSDDATPSTNGVGDAADTDTTSQVSVPTESGSEPTGGVSVPAPVTPTTAADTSAPTTPANPAEGSFDWQGYAAPMAIGGLLGAGAGSLLGGDDNEEEEYDQYGRRIKKKKGLFDRTTGALLGGAAGAGLGALYKNIYG